MARKINRGEIIIKEQISELKHIKAPIAISGIGGLGKNKLHVLAKSDLTEIFAVYDPNSHPEIDILQVESSAKIKDSFHELLQESVQGVVIEAPTVFHARQSIEALKAGKAVFCQSPLGRNFLETIAVVREAKRENKLLAVNFPYRHLNGIQALKSILDKGKLGKIYKVEAVLYHASGPDKEWYYNPKLSGGGCLIDLGSHMIDLFIYLFKTPILEVAYANILINGYPVVNQDEQAEDYAEVILTGKHISFHLTSSWMLSVGKDVDISFKVYGTEGGASFFNINGSFVDFQLDLYKQNLKETIVEEGDDGIHKGIQEWASKISKGNHYDESNQQFIQVATVVENIYNYQKD